MKDIGHGDYFRPSFREGTLKNTCSILLLYKSVFWMIYRHENVVFTLAMNAHIFLLQAGKINIVAVLL